MNKAQKTVSAAAIQAAGGLQKWTAKAAQAPCTASVAPGAHSPITGHAKLPNPGRSYTTDGMNKTESAYAAHLEALRIAGEILAWKYEPLKLKLADKTYYTPDFLVVRANGSMELHEVKGHWEDDARVKIKVAAEMNPWFTLLAVQWKAKEWTFEQFKARNSRRAASEC